MVELDPSRRLEMVFAFMEGELGVLQVEKKIRSRVKRQMEKTQREYYLNEQLKAIQRELGNEGEEGGDEIAELAEKIARRKLSKEARDHGNCRAEEAQDDGADDGRGDGRAQLSRRAARPAVGQEVEAQEGHRRGAGGARRGPLRRSRRSRTGSSNISRCRRGPTS